MAAAAAQESTVEILKAARPKPAQEALSTSRASSLSRRGRDDGRRGRRGRLVFMVALILLVWPAGGSARAAYAAPSASLAQPAAVPGTQSAAAVLADGLRALNGYAALSQVNDTIARAISRTAAVPEASSLAPGASSIPLVGLLQIES